MRKFFIGILLVAMSATIFAAPRTATEAAALAAQFSNSQIQKSGLKKAAKAKAADMSLVHQVAKPTNMFEPALYVFNKPNGGWVMVSADDNAYDILAYSNEGEFGINPNAEYMLDYYAEQIALAKPLTADQRIRRAKAETYDYAKIEPLLGEDNRWYQRTPYNLFCPIDQADSTRSMTGCVATAAALIMYHFRYPATGMGARAYDWKSVGGGWGHEYVDFTTGNYDWDHMLNSYHGSYTQEEGEAVAKLMYHCGVATRMEYGGEVTGGSGSGGTTMAKAMHENFGYTLGVNHKGLDTVPYIEVATAFENELKANRIVMMGGNAHEYVCDGADGEGKFHINLGWDGMSNGYYNLQAIVATEGVPGNYSKGMSCIFGIEPEKEEDRIHTTGVSLDQHELAMEVGEQQYVDTTVYPENATNVGVHFYSTDESVATVSYKGKVTALKAGHAIIKVVTCDGGYTDSCKVTVTNGGINIPELIFDSYDTHHYSSSDKIYKIYLQNAAHGQYPYIKLKLKEKDSSKKAIAGSYDLKGTEVWASATDHDLAFSISSGWVNVTCVGDQTYRFKSIFYDSKGNAYTFDYTTPIQLDNVSSLEDQIGDGASSESNVTFVSLGETYAVSATSNGKITLPMQDPLSCNEMQFIGWTAEQNYNSDDAPALVHDGDEITSDMTYYAVFATPAGPGAYTEAASIQFKAVADNDSSWYFRPNGTAEAGRDLMTDYVESSNNMNIIGGAWVRECAKGLKLGAYKTDNAYGISTNYDKGKNKYAYIVFGLDHSATISKITISAETTSSHDDGRMLVDPNGIHSQSPLVYGDNMEYIVNEPVNTTSLSLALNHRAAAIKNIKLYTGGTSYIGYTTTTCPIHSIGVASVDHGSVVPNLNEANAEDMVTITATPEAGYKLKSLSVKDADNNDIAVFDGEFFMPASDVTISAVFEAVEYGITVEDAAHGSVSTNKATAFAGETITITAEPENDNYELTSISVVDADSQAVAVENGQFIMPASNVTVSATFSAIQYAVILGNPENGTIKSDKATAAAGETVTITALADDKYTLAWLNVYSTTEGNIDIDANGQFIMPASDVNVSASFVEIKYSITKNSTDGGSINCITEAAEGQTVTISTNPSTNYRLASLSVKDTADNEIAISEDNKFTMPASAVTIYAEFERIYNVNISTSIVNGTVEADFTKAADGDTVTLTITPDNGYHLNTLSVSGGPKIGQIQVDENNQFVMPAANVTIMASFEPDITEYNIMVVPNIQNGTVTPDVNKAIEGQIVTLTVASANGYDLTSLTITKMGSSDTIGYDYNYQFAMPASNVIINATFTLITYGIVPTVPDHGSIDADKEEAAPGEVVTIIVNPNPGYKLETLTVEDITGQNSVEVDENYQFIMPEYGVMIYATFIEDIKTGINGINADNEKIVKVIENGVVYIIRGGEKFDIYGQKIQ